MERFITWEEIKEVANKLLSSNILTKETKVWGIPRGGQYLMPFFTPVDTPDEAEVILDDLIDSGSTLQQYKNAYPDKKFIAFFKKYADDDRWYIFPWEQKSEPIKDNIIRICQFYNLKEVHTIHELIKEYEKG